MLKIPPDQVAHPTEAQQPRADIDGVLANHQRHLADTTSPLPAIYQEDLKGRTAQSDAAPVQSGEGTQAKPRGPPAAQIMELPPWMSVRRTCEVTADSRANVYKKIAAGRYRAVKDGAKTLIETASVLEDLARLPAFADAKVLPPNKRGKRTASTADTTMADRPKRGRRRKGVPEVDGTASSAG
jgi:hypothetical protein